MKLLEPRVVCLLFLAVVSCTRSAMKVAIVRDGGGDLRGGMGGTSGTGGAQGTGGSLALPVTFPYCTGAYPPSAQAADVLLLLDRSGSMGNSMVEECVCDPASASATPACTDTTGCVSRWSALTSALGRVLSSTPQVHWGLKVFATPGGSSCSVTSKVEVPVAADSTAAIRTQMASLAPGGNTPTAAAITAATAYLATLTDANDKVILLSTDGQPNCPATSNSSASDVAGAVAAVAAASAAGFRVYVIGIGPSVGNLTSLAEAGGTDHYYPATSPSELSAALSSISRAVTTCAFSIQQPVSGLDVTRVFLDGKLVPRSVSAGWSTGGTSIVFNGASCDDVVASPDPKVEVCYDGPAAADATDGDASEVGNGG